MRASPCATRGPWPKRTARWWIRADRLQAALFPGGVPQERVHSLPFYAAHFGLARLKAAVLGAIRPGEASVEDLRP